jgi:tRNA nucleotidyltransferase (CCA-adding enzyme)
MWWAASAPKLGRKQGRCGEKPCRDVKKMNISEATRPRSRQSKPKRGWELFAHDADIGVRGFGPTKQAAFEQAAYAMTAVITEPRDVAPSHIVEVECEAPDAEFLLVEWLNALVFEMATRRMLFSRFAVHIRGGRLRGWAWGEAVDVARHEPAAEIKGATLTALRVRRRHDGTWVAQCVVDV